MNEGLTLDRDGDKVADFRSRWALLDDVDKDLFGRLAFDAARARVYIDLKTHCTERRLEIANAIHTLVKNDIFDHFLVREVVEQITGRWHPTAGEALGHLDVDDARQFNKICQLVAADVLDYDWDDAAQTIRVNLKQQENTSE